mgnify:CR=1 FL=1
MKISCAYVFAKSKNGFKKFIKEYIRDFRSDSKRYRFLNQSEPDTFEDKIEKTKYTLLYKEYENLLTQYEKDAIDYLEWHHKDEEEPKFYYQSISSAYDKWLMIFFNKNNTIYKQINPIVLGKEIELLIKESYSNKTEFASMVGVDRSTITAITEGARLPSLELFYKFSVIFKVSMDELISMALLK